MNFGRNNNFSCLTVGGLCERFQTLNRNHGVAGCGFIEHTDSIGICLLYGENGLRFTFGFADFGFFDSLGAQNCRLFFRLGVEDLRLLMPFGNKDFTCLFTLGGENSFTALTLGFHLFFHRVLNFTRRNDVFQFDTVDLNAPRVGRFVQNHANFRIDGVARGQGAVEFQFTDNITKRGRGQVFNRRQRRFYTVSVKLRVGNLEKYDRINLHGNIIFGDNRLRCEINHLLF